MRRTEFPRGPGLARKAAPGNPRSTFRRPDLVEPRTPRAPIAPVSDKRRVENRARSKILAAMRAEVEAGARPACAAAELLPDIDCGGPVDGHELLSRGRGGSITDRRNVVLVCRWHHTHITTNPTEAEALGLAIKSGGSTT